jgi:hypothetical protein
LGAFLFNKPGRAMLHKTNINPIWELGSPSIAQALPSNMEKSFSQAQLPSTKPQKQPKQKTQPKTQTKNQVGYSKRPTTTTKEKKKIRIEIDLI